MAIDAKPSGVSWWREYATRVHRSPEDIDQIMRGGARTPNPYPHVRLRLVHGKSEPFLPGTGLAVWEIVLLWRDYEGDLDALMNHFAGIPITRAQVLDALAYASTHRNEIDAVVSEVEGMTEERMRKRFPCIRVITFDPDPTDQPHP